MNPITKHLMVAIEPIIDTIKALRDELDAVRAIKSVPGADGKDGTSVTAIEVADALVKNHSDMIRGSDGANGANGAPGERGADGQAGAGIETKAYQAGTVYREGTIVTANIGQHFKALRDTVASTDSDDWDRIGSGGFRHVGTYKADMNLREGDIVRKDFGTFVQVNGQLELFAGRGAKGDTGAQGIQGKAGDNGRDGSTIVAAETRGFAALITLQAADGALETITLDFTAAFNEAIGNLT